MKMNGWLIKFPGGVHLKTTTGTINGWRGVNSEICFVLRYNYRHLHIPVCHLKMSVWEQDNGNNPAAHFKIKFWCSR